MPAKDPHSNFSRYNQGEALNAQLGQNGFEVVTDTNSNANGYYAVQFLEDSVFSAMTATGVTFDFSSVTFPKGQILFGNISSFQLTSGKVIAYLSGVPA